MSDKKPLGTCPSFPSLLPNFNLPIALFLLRQSNAHTNASTDYLDRAGHSTDPSSSVFAPLFSIHIDCSTPAGLQHDFIPRSNSPDRGHTNQTTNMNPDTRTKKTTHTHTDHRSYLTYVTDDRPAGSILLPCSLLEQSSKSSRSNSRLSRS